MTEDKKLNAAESLALIGRMIENTRNRMAGSAGLHLLTWGYVTVTTTLAVWGLASYFDNTHWNYLWFMLPLLGGALMYFTRPKAAEGSVLSLIHISEPTRP